MSKIALVKKNQTSKKPLSKLLFENWQLLVILAPGMLYFLIFRYLPMYGIVIAFKDYGIFRGIMDSQWVGIKHFTKFFSSPDFFILFKNTLLLGVYSLVLSFPFPIIFAIILNEARNVKFKKLVQTVSYLPSFLSVVVVSSMVIDMLSPSTGIINRVIAYMGFEKKYFMILPEWFRTIYIGSGIWQSTGFGAVIYIAALAGIDQQLYEAAKIDGCGRMKSIWHITIPGLMPTIATMFILNSGNIIRIGYEKVLLLYNPSTYKVADVFSTFVYRKGIIETSYSYATAVGLFESVVALIIVYGTNYLSRKFSENSLW